MRVCIDFTQIVFKRFSDIRGYLVIVRCYGCNITVVILIISPLIFINNMTTYEEVTYTRKSLWSLLYLSVSVKCFLSRRRFSF